MIASNTHYSPTGSVWRGPSVAISVVVHLVCVVGAIVLMRANAVDHSTPARTSLTFVAVAMTSPPVNHLAAPLKSMPRPVAAIDPPAPVLPKPAPLAVPPPPEEAKPAEEAKLNAVPPTPPPAPDIIAANVQRPQEAVVRVGAFGGVTVGPERPRNQLTGVTSAGFGDAAARPRPRAVPANVVGSAGFDREMAAPQLVAARPAVAVLDTPTGAFDTPIEIVSKPKPLYTDEAQALGLQGTVVLEVEFTASNDVRVVRVIRSLGHGLDEAAARAAEQIRFKPARRQGVPVDCRVTVQIEFRIT